MSVLGPVRGNELVADTSVPAEWWERVVDRGGAWVAQHAVLVGRLRTAQTMLLWAALAVAVVATVLSPAVRAVLTVAASGVLMLITMHALARTKTVSWQALATVYAASLWWAMVIAAVSFWVTTTVTGVFDDNPFRGLAPVPVGAIGAGTAVAALTEECLKLVPLAVVVAVAPGRARRFAAIDWLLLGFACGLAFMVAEESARAVLQAVEPSVWWTILGEEPPGVTWWPFGRGFGSAPGGLLAWYGGHQVLTALVSGACGLAVVAWRAATAWSMKLAVLTMAPAMWWLAVVDHFGFNASSQSPAWLEGETSSVPAVLRWSFTLTGHGWGRAWLLGVVVLAALIIDTNRVWPGRLAGGLPDVPVWSRSWTARSGLVGAVGRTVALAVRDVLVLVLAHARDGEEPRRVAAARGRAAAVLLRVARAEQFRTAVDGTRPLVVVAARRRARWVAAAAIVVLVAVATLGAAWLTVRVGPLLLEGLGSGWFAGVLERLGEWWNALPLWQQIAIGVAIAALIALSGGSLGLAFGISGVITYGLSHAGGLAALVRDPRGATTGYAATATPAGVALDLADFALTFAPGNFAGAAAGRGVRQVAGEFADNPAAFLDGVRARHLDDTGALGFPRRPWGEDAAAALTPPGAVGPFRARINGIVEHLTHKDLDAARRELAGEVVARKAGGKPWDHVREVREAQQGLLRIIKQADARVSYPWLDPGERVAVLDDLRRASAMLDLSEEYVPRLPK